MRIPNRATIAFSLLLTVFAASCGKKKVAAPPPPPPPAPATAPAAAAAPSRPVISAFVIEPSSVERNQTAVMRWNVSNATGVAIDNGIGTVPATGTRNLNPAQTMTYRLSATGPGGDATATATVTVVAPPPPPPPAPRVNAPSLESRIQSDLKDALFDYDQNNIRDDARAALSADAEALKKIFADFPTASILLEGHCDERGSAEYNLGLGDRRSTAARDFLVQLGIPAAKLKTISYGKERPVCTEADESCWQRNRRAHFAVGQ